MTRKPATFWLWFLWPALFLPLVVARLFGDRLFGQDWYAHHSRVFVIVYGIVGVAVVVALVLGRTLVPMLSFSGGTPETRRIRKAGRPARATILAVGENSGGGVVTVNDQPYLNLVVRVEDGVSTPYETNFDAIIPRASLPQVQPGAVVIVKVDPRDPRKVVLDY